VECRGPIFWENYFSKLFSIFYAVFLGRVHAMARREVLKRAIQVVTMVLGAVVAPTAKVRLLVYEAAFM
jgi:hypothetical protein